MVSRRTDAGVGWHLSTSQLLQLLLQAAITACKLWQLWRLAAVSRINHNDFGGALVTAAGQNNSIQFAVGAAVGLGVRVAIGDKLNA